MRIHIFAATAAALVLMSGCGKTEKLFNGKDLGNWAFALGDDTKAPAEVFSVKDGAIFITGEPFGYMYTKDIYKDYDLDVEWAWEGAGTNSGIFLNIQETTAPFPNCVECNLKAGEAGMFVLLGGAMMDEYVMPEDGVLPKFPRIDKKAASSEKPDGEWNLTHIEMRGGHVKVYVNGVFQNEGTDRCAEGHIGLQSEGGPVKFRSVVLKRR